MELTEQIIFFLLAFVSEIIGTLSGFGSSILFVPLASFFFDFKTVLGITAVFHVFSNLVKIGLFREGIQKEIILKLGIPAVIFVILGSWLTTFFNANQILLPVNILLLLLSFYLIYQANKTIEATQINLISGGIASGFIAGIAGTGGAIRGLVLAAFSLPKNTFIATSAIIDLGVDSSRAVVYLSNGYFERQHLYLIPFLFVCSLAGSYLGKLLLNHASEKTFRYLVLTLILLSSLYQISRIMLN